MVNAGNIANTVYNLWVLFNPEIICWIPSRGQEWVPYQLNWREYYTTRRKELAEMVLRDFTEKYRKYSFPSPDDWNGYEDDLRLFENALIQSVNDYRFNTFDKSRFINYSRIEHVTSELKDRRFANVLGDVGYLTTQKVTKEEMVAIIRTFCFCVDYIAKNLKKKVLKAEALTALELPVEVEELRKLVTECDSLGELFSWNKTEEGYYYWAAYFLDDEKIFKRNVYRFLNGLHPDLKLPIEKEEKVNNARYKLTINTVNPYVAQRWEDIVVAAEPAAARVPPQPLAWFVDELNNAVEAVEEPPF